MPNVKKRSRLASEQLRDKLTGHFSTKEESDISDGGWVEIGEDSADEMGDVDVEDHVDNSGGFEVDEYQEETLLQMWKESSHHQILGV